MLSIYKYITEADRANGRVCLDHTVVTDAAKMIDHHIGIQLTAGADNGPLPDDTARADNSVRPDGRVRSDNSIRPDRCGGVH